MKRVKLFTFFNNLILFAPLAFIIRTNKGIDGGDVFLLQAIAAIIAVVMEVPSGALADKIGLKRTLILAQVFLVASRIAFLTAHDFNLLLLDVIFMGFSAALSSGVIEAYVYKYDETDYVKTYSRLYTLGTCGFILSNLLFGLVVLLGEEYLIVGTLIANLISLVLVFSFRNIDSGRPHLEASNLETKPTKDLYKKIAIQGDFWYLSFINAVIGVGMVTFNMLFIVILIDCGFKEALFGTVILVYSVVELSVRFADKIKDTLGNRKALSISMVLTALIFTSLSLFTNMIALLIIGALALPLLIFSSIYVSELNNQFIDLYNLESQRVTILSVFNLAGKLIEAFMFFAIALGFSSPRPIFIIISILFVLLSTIARRYIKSI